MEIAPKMSLKKQKCQLLGYRHVSTLIIDNDCKWDSFLQELIFYSRFWTMIKYLPLWIKNAITDMTRCWSSLSIDNFPYSHLSSETKLKRLERVGGFNCDGITLFDCLTKKRIRYIYIKIQYSIIKCLCV